MLHTVKKLEYLEGYKLKLRFDDGTIKIVDLENMLKKAKNMLLPLVDLEYFSQVKCDGTTIYWPNGVDLCPDVLYKMGESITGSTPKRKRTARTLKSRKKSKVSRSG
ncbi:MAG: DUF2442 domain-containing protein [Chlamydiota bacterium]